MTRVRSAGRFPWWLLVFIPAAVAATPWLADNVIRPVFETMVRGLDGIGL